MREHTMYDFHTFDNPADLTFNQLLGINNQGLIAGFYGSGAAGHPNQGYLLTTSGTVGTFHSVDFPGVPQTQLTGLNDNGTAVGYFYPTNNGTAVDNQFGFYERHGVFTEVNNPHTPTQPNPGVLIENQLLGVNDHNIAVGFYNDASGNSHGYTYNINSGKFSADINDPFAVSTVAAAINNKDTVAGFYTDSAGATHGFLEDHFVFKTVDAPGATMTELLGVNDHGIAVGEDVVNGVTHGIIYDSHTGTFITLDDPNAAGSTVFNGINDKGDIVGFYTDAAGNTNGLLAVPDGDVHHHATHFSGWALDV
ncbi:hypothetical protein [Bradyrhizobium sp. CER78]|uniref:hypothetical protein n=1 Tax=Bradyrhizobium sp. CER78 TaxID=3039162 RepID=UPI002446EE5E|nr:hypothetical protein [Bradyrhizobium sp. CER78]MDH2382757.1 hypothetical protein [Bradyrhizobium sp. CER78]